MLTVEVGDRLRLSIAQLTQIAAAPGRTSKVVEVEAIIREPDGTKSLRLQAAVERT